MMPFTVVFSPGALAQLSDAWLAVSDKAAFSAAEERLERLLRRDPQQIGRHLSEGLWMAQMPPITLFFEILVEDQLVRVTEIDADE